LKKRLRALLNGWKNNKIRENGLLQKAKFCSSLCFVGDQLL